MANDKSDDQTAGNIQQADDGPGPGQQRLAQSLMLEEQGPGGVLRVIAIIIAIFAVLFLIWASLTKIQEVVVSSGEVQPIGTVKQVQHLEGGIVGEIPVKNGDLVEKGDVIMRLATEIAGPERDQLQTRIAGLEFEAEQLRALSTGQIADLKGSEGGRYESLASSQLRVYRAKLLTQQAEIDVIDKQISQKQEELKGLKNANASLRDQVEIVTEQVVMRMELMARGLMSKIVLLDTQRELERTKAELADNLGLQRAIHEAVAEFESKKSEMRSRQASVAAESLGKLNTEIAELRDSVQLAEDRVRRLEIRSPVRGVIQNLITQTLGGVLKAGETVAEVIPSNAELVVETQISTDDIGFVFTGLTANVKIVTYDYTRFGVIPGIVERISATTLIDAAGVPFYLARIKLDKNHVGDDPKRNLVVPGMTAIADIKTGEKTLAQYLLKPIFKATSEAFRER